MILDLHRQGLSVSAIARESGFDRKTVRRYIERGLEPPRYGPRKPRPRLLDPFTTYQRERVTAWPGLTGSRLLRELRELGYTGGYTAVTDYLRDIRPAGGRAAIRSASSNIRRRAVSAPPPDACGNNSSINPAAARKLIRAPRRASSCRYSAVERADPPSNGGAGSAPPMRARRGTRIVTVPWRLWIVRSREPVSRRVGSSRRSRAASACRAASWSATTARWMSPSIRCAVSWSRPMSSTLAGAMISPSDATSIRCRERAGLHRFELPTHPMLPTRPIERLSTSDGPCRGASLR